MPTKLALPTLACSVVQLRPLPTVWPVVGCCVIRASPASTPASTMPKSSVVTLSSAPRTPMKALTFPRAGRQRARGGVVPLARRPRPRPLLDGNPAADLDQPEGVDREVAAGACERAQAAVSVERKARSRPGGHTQGGGAGADVVHHRHRLDRK